MQYKDYYQIMGLNRDASPAEVKRAYRVLARKYHPDVSDAVDAEARFKEVGEAYEVLKDPEKRAAYDQLGSNWRAGEDFQTPPDWASHFHFSAANSTEFDAGQFSEFFENLFNRSGFTDAVYRRGPSRGRRARGEDSYSKVFIDLEDAYYGATRSLTIQQPKIDAYGQVVSRDRTLQIQIPKGVRQGQRIRLKNQGSPSIAGGEAGDLYLEVQFKRHPFYRVEGRDVFLTLPVTPWEASLGANVKIPTPTGKIDLTIPANSRGGRKLRLKGRGIPGNPTGDLYVVLEIALPKADSAHAKAAYQAFADAVGFNPRAEMGA